MHDPLIVIKDIHFLKELIITIWHKDPCSDGSDDSCGWSRPKLTHSERELLFKDLKFERWAVLTNWKCWNDTNRTMIVYTFYATIKWRLFGKRLNGKDRDYIFDLCFKYHDHLTIFTDGNNEQEVEMLFWCVARHVKYVYRKWWRHPRWHFNHWQIKFHKINFHRIKNKLKQ